MFRTLAMSLLATAIFSAPAFADPHPHDDKTKQSTTETDLDLEAYFEKHAKELREAIEGAKTESRLMQRGSQKSAPSERTTSRRIEIIEDPEALREAAKDIQNMLAESGLLESLADMVIGMAEDIEIVDTGDGMSLSFDGKKLGSFETDGEDVLAIESMGKNTRIEKETIIENGRKKTRIIIETDADNDVEFDVVPKTHKPESRRKDGEF
ncbi:hypothetical protein [Fretibacter rubidus]|uniref:hypothetical protein n=1 Tax=Fretibacter rubidus TaxID=570162 RepID=UPI00352B9D4E